MINRKGQLSVVAISLILLVLSGVTYVVVKNVITGNSITGNVIADAQNAVDDSETGNPSQLSTDYTSEYSQYAPYDPRIIFRSSGGSGGGGSPSIPPILDTGGY